MPFNPADIARTTVTIIQPDGSIANNVFTAAWNGTSPRDDQDAVDDFKLYLDDMYAVIGLDMNEDYEIRDFEVGRVIPGSDPEQLQFIGIGDITPQPSNVNEPLPYGVAMLFSARLNGPGGGSGKKYWPGFTEAACIAGIWDPLVVNNMVPAAQIWADLFGSTGEWIPGSYSLSKGFRALLRESVRSIPAYQRRRKQGVGQ